MRSCGRILIAVTLMVASGTAAAAQQARVIGRVLMHDTQAEPVAGATVRLGEAIVTTDQHGRFVVAGVSPGKQRLTVEMIGYAARTENVELAPDRTTEVVIALSRQPVELTPVTIIVRSPLLEENGFYERKLSSGLSGRWITRDEIEKRNPTVLTDLFRDVSGSRVHDLGIGARVIRFNRTGPGGLLGPRAGRDARENRILRLPGCQPQLYIDGRRHADTTVNGEALIFDFNVVNPMIIEAVEIYVGNAPVEFRSEGCGVVLIWTRRGEQREGGRFQGE